MKDVDSYAETDTEGEAIEITPTTTVEEAFAKFHTHADTKADKDLHYICKHEQSEDRIEKAMGIAMEEDTDNSSCSSSESEFEIDDPPSGLELNNIDDFEMTTDLLISVARPQEALSRLLKFIEVRSEETVSREELK